MVSDGAHGAVAVSVRPARERDSGISTRSGWGPMEVRCGRSTGFWSAVPSPGADQPSIVATGTGAMVAFADWRGPTTDLYAQQVSPEGVLGSTVASVGPGRPT